jgi:uncharacterized protein
MTGIISPAIPYHTITQKGFVIFNTTTLVMIEKLTQDQIESVLKKTLIGRIGCHADGETYVVPISFVYEDKAIYCYTTEGKKTAMMRKNPSVCFQTDKMSEMGNWQSVVVQGTFEELTGKEEKSKAMRLLLNRHLPFVTSVRSQIGLNWPFHPDEEEVIEGVLFRIVVTEISGRFETYVYLPNFLG